MFLKNLQKHFAILQKHGVVADSLFTVPPTPIVERYIRQYLVPVVNLLPARTRYASTALLKKVRNFHGKLQLHYPSDFQGWQLISEEIKGLELRPWWEKRAVVCLCHDIDNLQGYHFTARMAEIDAQYGIQSTFNFLTHDYPIQNDLLTVLRENNFEIGLHGDTHDQGFAFRSPAAIQKRLTRSLDRLQGHDIVGYRSPALSISHHLLRILGQMNFVYDSTMQIASSFYYSVQLPYPYYLEQFGIWEIPLMVQDDNYVRDTRTSEHEIFRSLQRFLTEIIPMNGVLVINAHPHLMVNRQKFYENFVRYLTRFSGHVAFVSMKAVIEYGCEHS